VGLSLQHEVLRLELREPFVIARSDHGAGHNVTTTIVELRDDRHPGLVGVGEGYPDAYYGETPETMTAVWPRLLSAVGEPELTVDGLAAAAEAMTASIAHHGAAKCALDIALHDLAAKVAGLPLHAFLGLSADLPPTDFTIGIDTPAVVAERAARAAHFPALKIKVGGPSDLATLEAVRAVFGGPIRVDANTAWMLDDAVALLPDLERLGVQLIEQPFRAGSTSSGSSRNSPRCRSSPTRAPSRSRISTPSSGSSQGSTSSSPSAAASARRSGCSSEPGSSASGRSSAAWRRHQSGSPPRQRSRRWPTGSISTATCCSPTTRSPVSPSGRIAAGSCPGGPVSDWNGSSRECHEACG